ncbi:MAG TPA: hypothetical protein VJZ49_06580 [Syntrophales bacterium]|nr:hypothetical protein [Syntrophales bacterium]
MKSSYRISISLVAGAIFLCAGIGFCQDNSEGKVGITDWTKIIESKVTDKVGDKGLVNYEEGYVESIGTGAPPEQYYGKPQARPMALRAAQVDAYRNLLETVQGVQIDSATTVKAFVIESDIINAQVQGLVKGAAIVNKVYLSDGTVEVTIRMPLSGIAKAVVPQAIADDKKTDMKEHKPVPFSKKQAAEGEVYTGLVVDARGLKGRPAMSPKIFDEKGAEVYGTLIVIKDYAVQQGICGYARDLTAAQSNPRVTNNPLTVKAISAEGASMTDFKISDEDAKQIRSTRDNLTYLQKCRVIIVLD